VHPFRWYSLTSGSGRLDRNVDNAQLVCNIASGYKQEQNLFVGDTCFNAQFSLFYRLKESMSEFSNVFEQFEEYLCAEGTTEYHSQKLQPFYFNPTRKTKLYCGDALNILKRVPDKCIDMIFADPPYFGNQSGLIISPS